MCANSTSMINQNKSIGMIFCRNSVQSCIELTTVYRVDNCVLSPSVMSDSWTVASQAHLSMEVSREEQWSRQPFPSPGDLTNPGIEPRSLTLHANSIPAEPSWKPSQHARPLYLTQQDTCSEVGRMESGGEWIHVHVWLSPTAIHLKLSQRC